MRRRRPVRLWLRRVLVAGVVLLVLLLLPPVQTWLARAALGSVGAARIEIGHLWLHPWRLGLEGLEVEAGPLHLRIEAARAAIAPLSSLGGWMPTLRDVEIRGAEIVFEATPPDERAPDREPVIPFRGLSPWLRLPLRFAIRNFTATGVFTLVETAAGRRTTVDFDLEGRDLAPTATGRVDLNTRVRIEATGEPLAALDLEASVEAAQQADATLSHLTLEVEATGTAAGLAVPGPVAIAASAEVSIDSTAGESIVVQLSDPGTPDRPPLATLNARFDPGASTASGAWTLGLRGDDLRPFMQGPSPPELEAQGQGTWAWASATNAFQVAGRLKAAGAEWGRWDTRLADIRPFGLELDVDVESDGGLVNVRAARLSLVDADQRTAARLETRQPFTYDRAAVRFRVPDVEQPLLLLTLDRLPTGWVRALTRRDTLQGGTLGGALVMTASGTGQGAIRALEPLRLEDLQLRLRDGRALPLLDLTLEPTFAWDATAFKVGLAPLRLRSATGAALDFEGEATVDRSNLARIDSEGKLRLRLPRLTALIPEIEVLEGRARVGVDLDALTLAVQSVAARARGKGDNVLVQGEFETSQALLVEMAPWRAVWSSARAEALSLRLNGFPLAWLSPWLPEVAINAGGLHGELHLVPRQEGIVRVEPDEPLEIRDLGLAFRGVPYRDPISASVVPALALSETGSALNLRDLRLRTAAGDRFDGEATFRTDPARPRQIEASASLAAEIPTLLAAVSRIGALRWSHDLTVDLARREIGVRTLEFGWANLKGGAFLEGEALQPFRIAVRPLRVTAEGPGTDVVRITARPMDLADLFPWALGLDLSGGSFNGTFLLRTVEGRLELATSGPLRVGPVHASWQGHPVFENLDLELTQEVAYGVGGAEVRDVSVLIRHDGEELGRLDTKGSVPFGVPPEGTTANARQLSVALSLSLPALRDQPIAHGLAPFARGRLTARGQASAPGNDWEVGIEVELEDVVPEGGALLPRASIGMTTTRTADGFLDMTLPIRLTSPAGDSDLLLRAMQQPGRDRPRLEASLASERLVLEDLMAIAKAFAPRAGAVSGAGGAPASGEAAGTGADRLVTALEHLASRRDGRPFWGGRRDVTFDLRASEVLFDRYRLSDLRGDLIGGADRLVVSALSAKALDGTIGLHAEVGFDAASETPYDARFRLGIDRLDGAQFFRAALPDQPPTLEGRYFGVVELRGTGRNPFDLARQLTGRIQLRGTNGVFRGLGPGTQRTGKQISMAGRLTFSKGVRALGRFIAGLGEMEFDRFEVSLNRVARGRLRLEAFELDARQARLRGVGTLTRDVTRPVAESAIDLELRMAAAGNLGTVFDELSLLEPGADESGFRTVRSPLALRGTIGQPDASALYDLLDEAVAGSRGSLRWAARLARREAAKLRSEGATGAVSPPPRSDE